MSRRNRLGRGAALAVAGLLAGCAVGPDFKTPRVAEANHYTSGTDPTLTSGAQGISQRLRPGAQVAADWWHLFNCAPLDAIVAEALLRNPGLQAAQASLRESEDRLQSGYGVFFPQAQADAAASRQRYSAVKLGQSAPASLFNLFTLTASASYVLDIFGGERRAIEGMRAETDIQRATEQATYVTLISNIVNAMIAAAAYRAEIDATQALIELQREQVRLAEVQVRGGIAPYSTVLSLRSQLASYEATVPQLQQRLAQGNDLLATLVGREPANWSPPIVRLADLRLPADLPVSLPSELVRQRPDILLAEATAHVASANVGVATAAMFPELTLNASYSANGAQTGNLLSAEGRAWNIGGGLTAPLFEGGALRYQRKATIDAYRVAMALYRQTVLTAFAQVADTLLALEHDASALSAQDEALDAAKEALHLVQTNYEAGLATYLEVLTADAQFHQAVLNDVQAVAVRYQDTVALYVALGGGWWSVKDPALELDHQDARQSSVPAGIPAERPRETTPR